MVSFQSYIPELVAYEHAWLDFINTGEINTEIIRPIIAQSWERCRIMGLDPLKPKADLVLSKEALNERIQKRQDLVTISRLFMDVLYDIVKGSGFRVDLVDEEGYILQIIGDEEALEICHKTNSIPGAKRSEEVAGTNSMSLCLLTKQPIQIAGAEHYARVSHHWTCSAAPIFNEDGKIMGVLNMGGRYELVHKHTLGMVVATAKAIEGKLKLQSMANEILCSNEQLKTTLESISDGIIYLDKEKKIIQINNIAATILDLQQQEMTGNYIDDVFSLSLFSASPSMDKILKTGKGYEDRELNINTKKKSFHCVVSIKPIWRNNKVDGLVIILKRSEDVRQLVQKMVGATARFTFDTIVGNNKKMKEAIKLARLAAGTSSRVIIEGESGTGKELFAQAIHNESGCQNGPFVAFNCSAVPRELIESELFGYEEGTFTGAKKGGMPGKFELAEGGTLFLDEIGDMPLEMQVKILRVLQENQVIRIGGRRSAPINVRVIAATNKNLEEEIRKGNFREDLYYRLNVIKLNIPPLRERRDDIPMLTKNFINVISKQIGKEVEDVERKVLKILMEYDWPGNVRELQNVIERAIVVSSKPIINVNDLPYRLYQGEQEQLKFQLQELKSLEEIERQAIINTLRAVGGNISKASKILKIGRNTFYRKLEKYEKTEGFYK